MTMKKKTMRIRVWKYCVYGLLCIGLLAICTGCGSRKQETEQESQTPEAAGYRDDVTVEELKAVVTEALGEDYWPNMALDAENFEMVTGISAADCEAFLAEMPMISTNVDTLIIIKAKEDKLQAVEDAVNAYRERLVNDTMQYPMNLGKIQASMVRTFGNYVCFVQLGADTSSVMDESEEAAIQYCQKINEETLGLIEGALRQS